MMAQIKWGLWGPYIRAEESKPIKEGPSESKRLTTLGSPD
jgi:hypothetical protein